MSEPSWRDFRETDIAPERIIAKEIEGDPHRFQHFGADDYFGGLEKDGLVVTPLVGRSEIRSIWLPNGGRVDRKISGILKYAAPESLGLSEALATEEVGLRALAEIATKQSGVVFFHATSAIHLPGVSALTRGETSRAMHENFSYIQPPEPHEQQKEREQLTAILGTLFALRPIFSGAGLPAASGFRLSQRSHAIGTSVFKQSRSRITHGQKTMANLEYDLSWGPARRIEDMTADANHSMVARLLSKGATSIVMRLVEYHRRLSPGQQKTFEGLEILKPVVTLRGVSEDLTLTRVYEFRDGIRRTAIEGCLELCELAQSLTRQVLLPRDEELALTFLEEALDILRRTNPATGDIGEAADFGLDWAILEKYLLEQTGLPVKALCSTNEAVVEATLRRHALPERHVLARQVRQNTLQTLGLGQLVAKLTVQAPTGTRAHLRGELIRRERDALETMYGDGFVSWKDGREMRLRPYQTALADTCQ